MFFQRTVQLIAAFLLMTFLGWIVWWILWQGGPLSERERQFQENIQKSIEKAREGGNNFSWDDFTTFDWIKACRVNTYESNLDVGTRLGVAVNSHPLNWWASTDGYAGIAFVDKFKNATTVRIPSTLVTNIVSPECYDKSSRIIFSFPIVNGYRKIILTIQ